MNYTPLFLGTIAAGTSRTLTISVPKPVSHYVIDTIVAFGAEAAPSGVSVTYQVA
jgi:hypothetical protein